jgi:hypothetical protein
MLYSKSALRARPAEGCARADHPHNAAQHKSRPAPARLPGAEIILLHRLRARAAATAGRLEHAHRVIELTARAWLG